MTSKIEKAEEKVGHTPGPWYAALGPQGGYVISDETNHFGLCQRASWPSRVEESEANAHLIASAPDLVAALEWIANNYANQEINHVDFRVEAKRLADAAISKSRGEQQ
jgi:hypothetical protein